MNILYKLFSITEARDILRTHREQNIRQSQKVIDIWEDLRDKIDKLGDESTLIFMRYFPSPSLNFNRPLMYRICRTRASLLLRIGLQ